MMKRIIGVLCALFFAHCALFAQEMAPDSKVPYAPVLLPVKDMAYMSSVRQKIIDKSYLKDERLKASYENLISCANEAIKYGPYSVTTKKATASSGDKHDYMSIGIYWWPDPSKPGGVPYLRKDGQVNPQVYDDTFDKRSLQEMSSSVTMLSLAYYFSGDERYSRKAAESIKVWFLNPETKMNPNMNFGQAVPGRNNGRTEGIIETLNFLNVYESALLLESSKSWTKNDLDSLKKWVKGYSDWLIESPIGKDDRKSQNNHGTWYDAQLASYLAYLGDTDAVKKMISSDTVSRLKKQVDVEGKMALELERTRPVHYTIYNLTAFMLAASAGEKAGFDLWNYKDGNAFPLRKALDFVIDYQKSYVPSKDKLLESFDEDQRFVLFLRMASTKYNDKKYYEFGEKILGSNARNSISNLLRP